MYIDERLGLACMVGLPLEKAFDSFKIGMSSTGRDYYRLIKIAAIGTAAGMIWNQRSFQVDCQALATNAKWWNMLQLLGKLYGLFISLSTNVLNCIRNFF